MVLLARGMRGANGAQGERNGRGRREGGMAAHEEQDECVVVRVGIEVEGGDDEEGAFGCRGGFAIEAGALAAHAIGYAAGGDVDEPGAGIFRKAFVRPLMRG